MLTLRRFDQQIRAFVLLRAHADPSCDGSKPQGPSHRKAMRRPEGRRIFTIGRDE
jgi:hypothetical protein